VGRGPLLQQGVLVYHDDESIYFECRGKVGGVVRYTFKMIEGLKIVKTKQKSKQTQRSRESNSRKTPTAGQGEH
jgi:hypothetical protein